MSYDELIHELRVMGKQISHYRRLTKEMHRLDTNGGDSGCSEDG